MAAPSWAPQPAAVAPHLRRYVVTDVGEQLDDFDEHTAVALADVQRAIASVARDVLAQVGPVPESCHDLAADVTALGAAAEAVLDLDRDLSRQLQDLYETRLKRLRLAVDDAADGIVDGRNQAVTGSWCGPDAWDVSRAAF